MTGSREDGGLRRPAPSFSSLLGNPEDERYSLSHAWVKNGDKVYTLTSAPSGSKKAGT